MHTKKSGNIFHVDIFLDFVWLTTRTCGEPDEIELAAIGVKFNGSGSAHDMTWQRASLRGQVSHKLANLNPSCFWGLLCVAVCQAYDVSQSTLLDPENRVAAGEAVRNF